MKSLKYVLIFKILFTVVVWAIPLLFFPKSLFTRLGFPTSETLIIFRLLGVAYVALITGYILGLAQINKGQKPYQAVWVGIASNGLAAAVLLYYGVTGEWAQWSIPSQFILWLSAGVTLAITLLLIRHRPT